MTKKNILLTGASGTVGFEALKQLIEKDRYTISVFDKKTKRSVEKLEPFANQIDLIYGDISNRKDLKSFKNIDVVIHLAAIIPPLADEHPEHAKKVNTEGTIILLNNWKRIPQRHFLCTVPVFPSMAIVLKIRIYMLAIPLLRVKEMLTAKQKSPQKN